MTKREVLKKIEYARQRHSAWAQHWDRKRGHMTKQDRIEQKVKGTASFHRKWVGFYRLLADVVKASG